MKKVYSASPTRSVASQQLYPQAAFFLVYDWLEKNLQLFFRLVEVARNRTFSATSTKSGEQQICLETDDLFYVLLFCTFLYTLMTFLFH